MDMDLHITLLLCTSILFILENFGANKKQVVAQRLSGPIFIVKPKSVVEFLNTEGGQIDCAAVGDPEPNIEWYKEDHGVVQKVVGVPSLLSVHNNGSVRFARFSPERYRQDVHSAVYRCSASNSKGTVVSTSVKVKAATVQQQRQIQAQVYDQYVITGNTAILKCHIPTFYKDHLQVVSWIREDHLVIKANQSGSDMAVDADGNLHIMNANPSKDLSLGYWCQIRNRLTGQTFLSQTAGRIKLTNPPGKVQPKISEIFHSVSVEKGNVFELICVAQGLPTPVYRWVLNNKNVADAGSKTITRHEASEVGAYIYNCIAENKYGIDRAKTVVTVTEKLRAFIEPNFQVVNSGNDAIMECKTAGYPIESIDWKLNGRALHPGRCIEKITETKVIMKSLERQNEGMYQCFVKNKWQEVQASAQIILGNLSPTFVRTFKSKTLQPGPSISLECVASGKPIPEVRWMFQDKMLIENERIEIKESRMANGTRISILVIKSIRTRDGGVYSCSAINKVETVTHKDTINVYGLPKVHKMQNITVAAGEDVHLRCHVSGYPVTFITWVRGEGHDYLPLDSTDYGNGTLILRKAKNGEDEGEYRCIGMNGRGQQDEQPVFLNILRKPKISPSISAMDLELGRPFSTICSVIYGDEPIEILWLKDGQTMKLSIGTDIATTKMYSVLQIRAVSESHAGNYTCIAQNSAGNDTMTVQLLVLVSPRWLQEPKSVTAATGSSVIIPCSADGYPKPKIKWLKIKEKRAMPFVFDGGKHQLMKNGSLMLKNVEVNDGGKYSCIASNGIVPNLVKNIKIVIGEKPIIKFMNESIMTKIRSTVRLLCKASGDKHTDITWRKGLILLNSDSKRKIKSSAERKTYISVLSILNTTLHDEGEYSCNTSNKYGWDVAKTSIYLKSEEFTDRSATRFTSTTAYVIFTEEGSSLRTESLAPLVAVNTASYRTNEDQKDAFVTKSIQFNKKNNNINTVPVSDSGGSDAALESRSIFGGHFDFTNILFVIPIIVIVILLIAVIVTLVIYLSAKRNDSNRTNSGHDERYDTLTRKKSSLYDGSEVSTYDRRYGRLERPLPGPDGSVVGASSCTDRNSAAYEIPDYYAGMKPYATLQLSSRKQQGLELGPRDSQTSV